MPQKERITVSLSRESARFLRAFRDRVRSPSMSALFEKIVADLQGQVAMEQLDARITAYYDSLRETDIQEDAGWGAIGEAALASQREEEECQPRPELAGKR